MPIYEYVCEKDGAVLELIRPMDQADAPVTDPEGKGRVFKRVHSTFSSKGGGDAGPSSRGGSLPISGGCCPCGKGHGQCGKN